MRTRMVVGAAVGMLAAVLVAGCGSSSGTTAAASSSTRPATTTTDSTTMTSAPATTTTKPASAPGLSVDMTIQKDGLALLAFTNTGKNAITLRGWPKIGFRNAADEALPVPEKQVSVPGAGPSISLLPGRTAFSGIQWVTGDKADSSTYVATTVTYTLPGSSAVPVNVIGVDGRAVADPELDLKSVEVGTIQPSSEGVLIF